MIERNHPRLSVSGTMIRPPTLDRPRAELSGDQITSFAENELSPDPSGHQ